MTCIAGLPPTPTAPATRVATTSAAGEDFAATLRTAQRDAIRPTSERPGHRSDERPVTHEAEDGSNDRSVGGSSDAATEPSTTQTVAALSSATTLVPPVAVGQPQAPTGADVGSSGTSATLARAIPADSLRLASLSADSLGGPAPVVATAAAEATAEATTAAMIAVTTAATTPATTPATTAGTTAAATQATTLMAGVTSAPTVAISAGTASAAAFAAQVGASGTADSADPAGAGHGSLSTAGAPPEPATPAASRLADPLTGQLTASQTARPTPGPVSPSDAVTNVRAAWAASGATVPTTATAASVDTPAQATAAVGTDAATTTPTTSGDAPAAASAPAFPDTTVGVHVAQPGPFAPAVSDSSSGQAPVVPMVVPTAITTVDAPVQASATPVASGVPAPVPAALAQLVGQQLGGPVAALARAGNGVHQITVHLRPAELGAVQVVATFGDAGTTVQLRAGTDATREVLRAALADLDTDLAAAGAQGTSVEVSDQPPSHHPGTGHPGDGAGRRQASPAELPGGTGRNRDAGPVPPAAGRTGPARGRALDIHV